MVVSSYLYPILSYLPPIRADNKGLKARKRTKKGLANLFCPILKHLYFSMLRIF